MRARVRMDDGESSDWFGVKQGLLQSRELVSLLNFVFFTAGLALAERRLKADAEVYRDLVQILGMKGRGEKESGGGIKGA